MAKPFLREDAVRADKLVKMDLSSSQHQRKAVPVPLGERRDAEAGKSVKGIVNAREIQHLDRRHIH